MLGRSAMLAPTLVRAARFRAGAAFAAGVLVLLLTSGARADEAPCPAAVARWVARAALETGTPMRTVVCPRGLVVVRLEPSGAPPLVVDIEEGDGPSFRRAGRFRLTPHAEVDDFWTLPRGEVDAFERFAAWVAGHPGDMVFAASALPAWVRGVVPDVGIALGGPWLLLAALALVLVARVRRVRPASSDLRVALPLFAAALVLRLVFGAWGPLHINGQGPLWIQSAMPHEAPSFYGPGYAEVFGWLARLAGTAPDAAIFAANGVLSALAVTLAFAIARRAGLSRPVALLAAVWLAIDPVAIRMAATETYLVPIIALTLASGALGLHAMNHAAGKEWSRAMALALASALLTTQAARVHPSGWVPAMLAPMTALACPRAVRLGWRLVAVGALYALTAVGIVVTSARALLDVGEHIAAGDLYHPAALPPSHGVLAIVVVIALAMLCRPKGRWLAVVGTAQVAALLVTRLNYAQGDLWLQANERLYVALPVIALAASLPEGWLKVSSARAWVAGLTLVVLVAWWPAGLLRRTTQQQEYAWTRAWLSTLPPDCRTVHVAFAGHHELLLPTYAASPRPPSAFLRIDARQAVDLEPLRLTTRCTYYLHTSLCATGDGRPACDEVERTLELAPVARASFPAVADSSWSDLGTDPVEVAVSRVVAVGR